MQPQETGGFDWMHAISALGGALFGAIGGLFTGIWRLARIEPHLHAEIKASEKRVEDKIEETERRSDEKVEDIVGHFQEAFSGIRQQINDRALEIERDFMRKKDYESLRREDREGFERFQDRYFKEFEGLKRNIAEMLGKRQ